MNLSVSRMMNTLQTVVSQTSTARPPVTLENWTPRTDWSELIPPDERTYFRRVVSEIEELQRRTGVAEERPIDRGFHAKPHTVVRGKLTVADGIPAPARQGVCREPASYTCWVRFSNGGPTRRADALPDIRGMAVKILEAPGTPLSPGHNTFDLLTILQATQPARDIRQFMGFVRAAQNPLTLPLVLAREIGVLEAARTLAWLATHLSRPVFSMATQSYYTAVPLAWGPYAAKCSFRSLSGTPALRANRANPDFLRRDLIARLERGALRWEFLVQLYVDAKKTPIEDASIPWNERDSPFVKVGELVVGPENVPLAEDEGEQARLNKMMFSPWHAPEAHRPLGSIMRARRAAYEASSLLREGQGRQ